MTTAHRQLTLWLVATLASANLHPATDSDRRPVIVVVLHNYASIAPRILEHAAREVERTFAPLGLGVRWMAPPLDLDARDDSLDELLVATIHIRLFRRDGRDRTVTGVLGVDAPPTAGSPLTVAHVLYEPTGDDSTSAIALAYVMARLVGNIAMTPGASRGATIVRAARDEVQRLQQGGSTFTAEEAARIRAGVRTAER
jgi:hypothetical protein